MSRGSQFGSAGDEVSGSVGQTRAFPQSIDATRNEKTPPASLLAQRIGGYFSHTFSALNIKTKKQETRQDLDQQNQQTCGSTNKQETRD